MFLWCDWYQFGTSTPSTNLHLLPSQIPKLHKFKSSEHLSYYQTNVLLHRSSVLHGFVLQYLPPLNPSYTARFTAFPFLQRTHFHSRPISLISILSAISTGSPQFLSPSSSHFLPPHGSFFDPLLPHTQRPRRRTA